ncbi:hypothetical protein QYE76_060672 [Lolium multiflorum]|uniref:Transposase (putative) gypsy type domain-containing protein n=1 Tax=Lolium multiflorum TaxID=4521 RepID=A0AAD8S2L9_LOLMU|nr:hypothetical protein QYE76_060672 [Lolium multiflorum]
MAAEDLEWERSKIANQDMNLLKKLGFTKKENALRFPKEESYPSPPIEYRVSFVDHLIRGLSPPIHEFLRGLLFVYGLQLHQLTLNSILHVLIFITLCECFLGVQPNWALWKRIFCLRRNGSHNVASNIGGVVICVRSDVEYFDIKFPDSVQGWRKRWLYVHEESSDSVEYNIAPFDGGAKILRRRSWDAEATEEEKLATEALMTRIHELQNTRGKELSGVQITTYFLRIRNHPVLASLPPLPEGGEVEERTVFTDGNQGISHPESEVAGSQKSAASSKEAESEATASTHSLPSAVSPRNKRRRDEGADSSTSKAGAPPAEEVGPSEKKTTFNPYEDALVSSGDEDEDQPIDATARTSTSRTLVVSEAQPDGDETSPPQQNIEHPTPPASPHAPSPKRARVEPTKEPTLLLGSSTTPSLDDPLMKEFIHLENLVEANKRADSLARKLEQSEKARRTHQDYELDNPEGDCLLDALSLLEIHGDEAREGLTEARSGLSRLFPYFFPKKEEPTPFVALAKHFNSQEDLGLKLRQEGLKVGVEGTIALVADSQQNVDWARVGDAKEMETKRWQSLIKAAKPNSKKILAYLGCKPTPAPSSSKPEVK